STRRAGDPDRAADLAEPGANRRRSASDRPRAARVARGRRAAPVRDRDSQLRPVHLLLDALPPALDRADRTDMRVRVIGVRSPHGDDAVGLAVAVAGPRSRAVWRSSRGPARGWIWSMICTTSTAW